MHVNVIYPSSPLKTLSQHSTPQRNPTQQYKVDLIQTTPIRDSISENSPYSKVNPSILIKILVHLSIMLLIADCIKRYNSHDF